MSTGSRAKRSNQYLPMSAGEIGRAAGGNRQAVEIVRIERQVERQVHAAAKSR